MTRPFHLANFIHKAKRRLAKILLSVFGPGTAKKPNPYIQEQTIKYQEAKAELIETGLFKEIWSLQGWTPVQGEGLLSNGNWFYFHARGENASLDIAVTPWEEPYLARFEEVVTPGERFTAGYLPAERTKELIIRWVQSYLDSTV